MQRYATPLSLLIFLSAGTVARADNSACPDPDWESNHVCLEIAAGNAPDADTKTFSLNGRHEFGLGQNSFMTWIGNQQHVLFIRPIFTVAEHAEDSKIDLHYRLQFSGVSRFSDTPTTIWARFRDRAGAYLTGYEFLGYLDGRGCGDDQPVSLDDHMLENAGIFREAHFVDLKFERGEVRGHRC
jgi:hypothetical protein